MANLVLRTVKGSPLTNQEVDGNFSNLLIDIGILNNLDTDIKSNLVAAINEVKANIAIGFEAGAIANAKSEVRITGANSSIFANVNGNVAFILSQGIGSNANVKVNGNLQDSSGRVLRILDETGVVVWGG